MQVEPTEVVLMRMLKNMSNVVLSLSEVNIIIFSSIFTLFNDNQYTSTPDKKIIFNFK